GNVESRDRQRRGHGIAAVERAHGVLVFVGAHDENSGDTGDQPEGARHQRKKNPEQAELLEKRHTQNHGADVLGGGRFKKVSASTGSPETAPPRSASCRARFKLLRAALAARMLVRMETNIPTKPANPEHKAPVRNATTVLQASAKSDRT